MVTRVGGSRRKTRYKMQMRAHEHGRVRITAFMEKYASGDKVALTPDPSVHKGMFHPRHIGRTGVVVSNRGTSYLVKIHDQNKEKTLIVHPVHLRHV